MTYHVAKHLTFLTPNVQGPWCPDCGKRIRVTAKGLTGRHGRPGYPTPTYAQCAGTGEKPWTN